MVPILPLIRRVAAACPCRIDRKARVVPKFSITKRRRRAAETLGLLREQTLTNKQPEVTMSVNKINFAQYDVLGFDMDYTIARYEFVPFFNMVYEGLCKFLVEKKNYDSSIFNGLHEDKDLIYKGLIVDFEKGNVLKLGHDGFILRATHGTKKLSHKEIEAAYKDRQFVYYESFKQGMKSADGKWRFFENYFDIPGLVAFAKIIDNIREKNLNENSSTYEHVWVDILSALEDLYTPAYFSENKGNFFCHMKNELNKYTHPASQQVKDWLKALRQDNRKLFLLTSSYPDFATHVMEFVLGSDWKSYFDLILFGGRKPKFFTESKPFVEIKNEKMVQEVSRLQAGGEYCNGNYTDLMVFLRELTRKQNPKVIYFGDNLWADAWPSKTLGGWDSVLVLEEMDAEGYVVLDDTVPGHKVVIDPSKPLSKQKIKYELEHRRTTDPLTKTYINAMMCTHDTYNPHAQTSLVDPCDKNERSHPVLFFSLWVPFKCTSGLGFCDAEEIELMVSNFWGSIFMDENSTINGTTSRPSSPLMVKQMNTAFGDLISQYSDICVPSIEYLAGVPVDHNFTRFSAHFGDSKGFHPGCPQSLLP